MLQPHQGKIMFCRRYRIRGIWDIAPGAILDIHSALPRLIRLCQKLYDQNEDWFVGDIALLTKYSLIYLKNHRN